MLLFLFYIMWFKIWKAIEKPFLVVASLSSIISVVAICFNDPTATIVAVCALCIALAIVLISIIRVLNRFLEKNKNGDHKCISSFVRYRTDDGENIEFDSHKLIQSKCSIMQYFDIKFNWTGKNFPSVTSDLQCVEIAQKSMDANSYDTARLRLKKPVLYNETTVIHFKTKTNDAEKVSVPKVELYVEYPIEFIQVNIVLAYKNEAFNSTAKVERLRINSKIPQKYELIDSIPFDGKTKQYSYCYIDPEPGYFYRISWER